MGPGRCMSHTTRGTGQHAQHIISRSISSRHDIRHVQHISSSSIQSSCVGMSQPCQVPGRPAHGHRPSVIAQSSNTTKLNGVQWDAPPVVVVGAGIAGLATAIALNKVGIPVTVLESAAEGARVGEGAAIGLWDNAWRALDVLGVSQALRPKYLRLNRVELCTSGGKLLRGFGFDETEAGVRPPRSPAVLDPGPAGGSAATLDTSGGGSEFRGVRRSDLIKSLAAALPAGTIRSNATVARVSNTGGSSGGSSSGWPSVVLENGQVIEASVVVGSDGVRSAVAAPGTGLGLPPANFSGYAAYRGVAKLAGGIQSINLPANTIRQVWGQGVRAGLYPLDSTSVYWFTCFNVAEDAPIPAGPAAFRAEALSHVQGWSPTWGLETAINSTALEDISRGRISDRWTTGAFGQGLVTLSGDAAHPMTPNLGQGGCTALEDAVVLARAIASVRGLPGSSYPAALAAALRQYEQDRSSRCLPITVRSYLMGAIMQMPYAPVCFARDLFVSTLFPPSHFLDHTTFDFGELPVPANAEAVSSTA